MALDYARGIKKQLSTHIDPVMNNLHELRIFKIQWHKILASSFACFSMFLIGAPLGAIIRRGGLGIPVLISIFFFILFYILTMMTEKWVRQGILSPPTGGWIANAILLIIGFFFLAKARSDSKLLDIDFYTIIWEKLKKRLGY